MLLTLLLLSAIGITTVSLTVVSFIIYVLCLKPRSNKDSMPVPHIKKE